MYCHCQYNYLCHKPFYGSRVVDITKKCTANIVRFISTVSGWIWQRGGLSPGRLWGKLYTTITHVWISKTALKFVFRRHSLCPTFLQKTYICYDQKTCLLWGPEVMCLLSGRRCTLTKPSNDFCLCFWQLTPPLRFSGCPWKWWFQTSKFFTFYVGSIFQTQTPLV